MFGTMSSDNLCERFFYCGGCIRFMVRGEVNSIISFYNRKLEEVDDKRVLLNGLTGVSFSPAVNCLVSVRPCGMTYVVSQYVSRQLALTVGDNSFAKKMGC